MRRTFNRRTTLCRPPYENAPKTGVFASRAPVRPNPVALTTARIIVIDAEAAVIEISPVDAFSRSPVLELRPYIPALHRLEKFSVPPWVDHWSEWFTEQKAEEKNIVVKDYRGSDFSELRRLADNGKVTESGPGKIRRADSDSGYKKMERSDVIRIIGARQNNLKGLSLDIALNKITVITGLSGSGKSTLAFDTLYAESRRRFLDSMSSAGTDARALERPLVDQIQNLPPAIAIQQRAPGRNIRSTVGTVSEINDYLRLLLSRVGRRHCPECGRAAEPRAEHRIIHLLEDLLKVGVSFNIHSVKSGRLLMSPGPDGSIDRSQLKEILKKKNGAVRVKLSEGNEFILHTRNKCYHCGRSFFELAPSSFSSTNPESMCLNCNGTGTVKRVLPELVVSHPEKSILDGASDWWGELGRFLKKPTANWMKGEVIALARRMDVDLSLPWNELSADFKNKALFGTGNEKFTLTYNGTNGRSGDITRPVSGAVNNIERLSKGAGNKGSAVFYAQFMKEDTCPVCGGSRLNEEYRSVLLAGTSFPEVSSMAVSELLVWIEDLPGRLGKEEYAVARDCLEIIAAKIGALVDVGLHYLSLGRSIPTLSGGEAVRLRLASQLGCGLSNMLYILDEPTAGLHKSDRMRLADSLVQLRDSGNTIVVVAHDPDLMRKADFLADIGPGAGHNGGSLIASGAPEDIIRDPKSATGAYLSGKKTFENFRSGSRKSNGSLKLSGAYLNNLKDVDLSLPLGLFICVSGKSGSGKSSLVTKTLSPALAFYYKHGSLPRGSYSSIIGLELLEGIVTVSQEAIGRSPRSTPATYTGVFDEIRRLFAKSPAAREKRFSEKTLQL